MDSLASNELLDRLFSLALSLVNDYWIAGFNFTSSIHTSGGCISPGRSRASLWIAQSEFGAMSLALNSRHFELIAGCLASLTCIRSRAAKPPAEAYDAPSPLRARKVSE